jgi:phosphate-selective porin OprO/OprP
MRNSVRKSVLTASIAAVCCTAPLPWSAGAQTVEELRTLVDELNQKVRVLERKAELEGETAAERAKNATSVSIGSTGFQVRSVESNFVFRVRGYIQADTRWYPDDYRGGTVNDTFLMRRVRPIFEGTVFQKYDYRIMLDFASGITSGTGNNGFLQDGYITARFLPEFQIQAGKMKEPVGLERLQSGANLLFVERGYPTQLVPNRDVGVQLQGEILGGTLTYAGGAFNGVADGGSGDIDTAEDEKDVAGRMLAQPLRNTQIEPLRGLAFGVGGSYGNQAGALRNFVTAGQQTFFTWRTGTGNTFTNVVADGNHWRVAPQAYYYWGPLGVFGEYVLSSQTIRRNARATATGSTTATIANVHNIAWQVAASWILTGEENSFKGFTPRKPLSLANRGWGAWEIAARYGELKLDDELFPLYATSSSGQKASSWGAGLNWYLNRNVKLQVNYEQSDFSGGGTSPLLEKGEKIVFTRAQLAF